MKITFTIAAVLSALLTQAIFATERVALVIGNNAYQHGSPLKNCVNDAKAVSAALKDVGFEVIEGTDLSLAEMEKKVLEFKRKAEGAKAAWFHYSGHGAEVNGSNFLIPVDAKVEEEFQVKHKTYALDQLMAAMQGAGTPLKVVVLDCCRDNPFGRGWSRNGGSGLAQVADTPAGTVIAFATSPGKVAADGVGKNSPFTAALVKSLAKPGLDIDDVFKETGRQVLASTGQRQRPWRNSSYYGHFVVRAGVVNDLTPPIAPTPEPLSDDYELFAGREAGERKMVEVAPGVSIPFRWCPPGSFTMGSPKSEQALAKKWDLDASDEIEHRVTLTKGFWLAETEVTQGQWQAVMKTSLREQAKKGTFGTDIGVENDNVVMYYVNHDESADWCARVSRYAGVRGWMVQLPTEAQWEYACRAGTSGMTYAGDFEIKGTSNAPGLDGIAWYSGNSSQGYSGSKGWNTSGWKEKQYPGGTAGPRRVGTRKPNAWGLHDMIGNVWEWCGDWYDAYDTGAATDPQGPSSGDYRVHRGGSWINFAAYCRAANRSNSQPGSRIFNLGFRPALVPSR